MPCRAGSRTNANSRGSVAHCGAGPAGRQLARTRDAVAQDPLEVGGIVRVRELARARKVQVVQPRQPEAQRRRAQQRWPGFALVRRQRAQRVVRGDHRVHERGRERRVVAHAPVVHGDREVVREEVGGGEAEVDDPRDAAAGEQHVVAEEVAVNGALRQLAAAESGLEPDLRVEQRRPAPRRGAGAPRARPGATTRVRGGSSGARGRSATRRAGDRALRPPARSAPPSAPRPACRPRVRRARRACR